MKEERSSFLSPVATVIRFYTMTFFDTMIPVKQ
jgi:hypothetical protein